jgi:hypothetical protein
LFTVVFNFVFLLLDVCLQLHSDQVRNSLENALIVIVCIHTDWCVNGVNGIALVVVGLLLFLIMSCCFFLTCICWKNETFVTEILFFNSVEGFLLE